ncbi:hypothetical protein EYF80_031878 [Liparis tanakae]|uniref:Uncharacterized protein n=1 Tax=Liparis tanakae TaxID=230148 RepID=A0A4Z2GWQ1_9TELE|nr:hypothetical protein EYF80_031878 [Liparis tanakae]
MNKNNNIGNRDRSPYGTCVTGIADTSGGGGGGGVHVFGFARRSLNSFPATVFTSLRAHIGHDVIGSMPLVLQLQLTSGQQKAEGEENVIEDKK